MTMSENFDLKRLFSQIKLPAAEWVGARHMRKLSTERAARNGQIEDNSYYQLNGVMVEAMVDGHIGYCATRITDAAGIEAAAERAYQLAKLTSKYKTFSFDKSVRPPSKGEFQTSVAKKMDALSPKEIQGIMIETTEWLKVHEAIVDTQASLLTDQIETCYVSTNGADLEQQLSLFSLHMTATGQKNGLTQRRSLGGHRGYCRQGGLEFLNKMEMCKLAQKIGEEALELLDAEPCPAETCTLVLSPEQMMLQIHESIGHPLELDRILNDEANFAGQSFVKLSDFGKLSYGTPLLNVTYDPYKTAQYACFGFDDGGAPATREFLIKDGVLVRALGGLESQARTGILGVANFRATSWDRAPIDRMANINVEPGSSTLEEMISSVERGVWMTTNCSWSIDDHREKFQFGCEYAKLIENGKFTKTLRDPNYRGTTLDFWHKLKMVGDPQTVEVYGAPTCGKGEPSQVIWVGHASPTCLFDGIEVFGGGQ